MSLRILTSGLLLTVLGIAGAQAQGNTAQQVTPGYLTTSGCPSGYTPCFQPTGGASYLNITTSTNTQVKAAPGVFLGLSVNTPQSGDTAVVYDNTACSGTLIGTFSTAAIGVVSAAPQGIAFGTGLCVTTTGGTPANVTILYK